MFRSGAALRGCRMQNIFGIEVKDLYKFDAELYAKARDVFIAATIRRITVLRIRQQQLEIFNARRKRKQLLACLAELKKRYRLSRKYYARIKNQILKFNELNAQALAASSSLHSQQADVLLHCTSPMRDAVDYLHMYRELSGKVSQPFNQGYVAILQIAYLLDLCLLTSGSTNNLQMHVFKKSLRAQLAEALDLLLYTPDPNEAVQQHYSFTKTLCFTKSVSHTPMNLAPGCNSGCAFSSTLAGKTFLPGNCNSNRRNTP